MPPRVALAIGVAVPPFAWLLRKKERPANLLLMSSERRSYQRFIDRQPILWYSFDKYHKQSFGESKARFLPELIDRFDWFVDHCPMEPELMMLALPINASTPRFPWVEEACKENSKHLRARDPTTVYVAPSSVYRLLAAARKSFDPSHSNRVVVFGGSDLLLSDTFGRNSSQRAAVVAELRRFFRAIFYFAKDVEVEGVTTQPTGLNEAFLRQDGVVAKASAAISAANLSRKPFSVLAAWGAHSHIEEQSKQKQQFAHRGSLAAQQSRRQARVWAASKAAAAAKVDVRWLSPLQWWPELARYRFLLSPLGAGLQSPKNVEALLVLTVPIVQRFGFVVQDDLVRLGFPLAVVGEWAEVTTSRLGTWWDQLAPSLVAFRARCLSTAGYWALFSGHQARCGE